MSDFHVTHSSCRSNVRLVYGLLRAMLALAAMASPVAAQPHEHSGLPHNIPDFSANATIRAAAAGPWSSAATWSPSRVPTSGDVVYIPAGFTVTYNIVSDQPLRALGVAGTVAFAANVNTRVTVGTLQVLPGGYLEIGRADAPIAASVRAEVVIADQPITEWDQDFPRVEIERSEFEAVWQCARAHLDGSR